MFNNYSFYLNFNLKKTNSEHITFSYFKLTSFIRKSVKNNFALIAPAFNFATNESD